VIHLRVIADGPRDHAMLQPLVARVLNCRVDSTSVAWREIRLHKGAGYRRRLAFAMRQAADASEDGVVAVVDRDTTKRRERITELELGRDDGRQAGLVMPTACGQADPHGEAWLLDDIDAVKRGLQLPAAAKVPSPAKMDPKSALERLHRGSPRCNESSLDVWRAIAACIDPPRCRNAGATGFEAFVADVQREFAPLVASRRA
jgi:hypothetical protein